MWSGSEQGWSMHPAVATNIFPADFFSTRILDIFLNEFHKPNKHNTSKTIMATSSASRPHKRARVTHETIHRPYQNPNHAESSFSNRGRIRDIQRRLRLEASRAKKPVETHIHEERRTKEARLPADKKREYERELIELLRDEAIKEAEKKRNLVMRRYKKVKFIGKLVDGYTLRDRI
jgi:hypothetical protein